MNNWFHICSVFHFVHISVQYRNKHTIQSYTCVHLFALQCLNLTASQSSCRLLCPSVCGWVPHHCRGRCSKPVSGYWLRSTHCAFYYRCLLIITIYFKPRLMIFHGWFVLVFFVNYRSFTDEKGFLAKIYSLGGVLTFGLIACLMFSVSLVSIKHYFFFLSL